MELTEDLFGQADRGISNYDIYKIRKRLNMTKVEFSKILGVSSMQVARWERGVNKPDQMKRVALNRLKLKLDKKRDENIRNVLLAGGVAALLYFIFKD